LVERTLDLGWHGRFKKSIEDPVLYNLDKGIGETPDVSLEYPDVVMRLQKMVLAMSWNLETKTGLAKRITLGEG
jgi:hypothetical protein